MSGGAGVDPYPEFAFSWWHGVFSSKLLIAVHFLRQLRRERTRSIALELVAASMSIKEQCMLSMPNEKVFYTKPIGRYYVCFISSIWLDHYFIALKSEVAWMTAYNPEFCSSRKTLAIVQNCWTFVGKRRSTEFGGEL